MRGWRFRVYTSGGLYLTTVSVIARDEMTALSLARAELVTRHRYKLLHRFVLTLDNRTVV